MASPNILASEKNFEEIEFKTRDGLRLKGWYLFSKIRPRGNVLIVHGIKDYSDRYLDFAHELSQNGFNVFAYDLRGHGRSEGEPAYFESFALVEDDLKRVLSSVQTIVDGPWFIIAHGIGGAITTRLCIHHERLLKGIVLSAPFFKKARHIGKIRESTIKLLARMAPHFKLIKIPNSNFSKDKYVVNGMFNNKLLHDIKIPAKTGAELLGNMKYLKEKRKNLKTPFLILHGTADLLSNIKGTFEFYNETGVISGKEMKIYDGFYHDLLHEPEHRKVEEDIITWLKGRL